jgi:DNA/RNA-binding domain of Phe-tRNA-synthetase-like protein
VRFAHAPEILAEFPELSVTTLALTGIDADTDTTAAAAPFLARATERLAGSTESEFTEIAAWRRAFSRMGLKPTQYRCASEALLRRYRTDGALPWIHPLVDLCNAVSLAFAIPIAVFDLANVMGDLTVRHATGAETYLTFGGATENPNAGEVIFADDAGNAHARRWCNRQSALSAIRPSTHDVLIVCEAMHDGGNKDVAELRKVLLGALPAGWAAQNA